MRKHVIHISVYEVFLCMFVILIHLLSEGVSGFTRGSLPSALFFSVSRLVSFAVPAFIFSSGLKLGMKFRSVPLRYPGFIWGRVKKIYLPYLFWAAVYYLFFVFCLHYFPFSWKELGGYLLNGEISAQFYFIIVIMQFYLLMPLWILLLRKLRPGMAVILAALITLSAKILTAGWEYNDRLFLCYLVFWIIGCAAGLHGEEKLRLLLKRLRGWLYSGWIIFAALHVGLNYLDYFGKINYAYPEPLMILFSVFSMLGFYLLLSEITPGISERGQRLFGKLGGASYYIFLFHCLVIAAVDHYLLGRLGIASLSARFVIRSLVVYPVSILVCLCYTAAKQKLLPKKTKRQ